MAFFREKEQKSHFKVQSPSKLNTFDLTFFSIPVVLVLIATGKKQSQLLVLD